MANVPDTETFNFQQVADAVYGDHNAGRNLVDSFDDAIEAYFDPVYSGNKNNLLNFRNYGGAFWFVYMNYRTFTLLEVPKLWHTYSSVFGPNTPASVGEWNPWRKVFNDDFEEILTFGTEPPVYLYNTIAEVTQYYEASYTWGWFFDENNYTKSRIGTFYFAITYMQTYMKLMYPDLDIITNNYTSETWNTGASRMFFKFSITEAISPTYKLVSKDGLTNSTLLIGADGDFTVSVISGSTWIHLDSTSGSDNDSITFDVYANTGFSRSGTIRVTTSNGTYDCTISQGSGATLNVSPSSLTWLETDLSNKTVTISITPDSTFSASLSIGTHFEIVSISQSLNEVTVKPKGSNTSGSAYTDTLTIKSTGFSSKTVNLTQDNIPI